MIHFDTSVHIDRPRGEVFGTIADPETYPRWNSAVTDVTPLAEAGRYRILRTLPTGPAENLLEIVSADAPEEVVIRASDGPTPFTYRYRLEEHGAGTDVHLDANVELGGVAGLLGPVAGRVVRRGVDENLATLKQQLEHGR